MCRQQTCASKSCCPTLSARDPCVLSISSGHRFCHGSTLCDSTVFSWNERLSRRTGFRFVREDLMDLRKPHEWYSMSRSIKRRIIYHSGKQCRGSLVHSTQRRCCSGPTNSGKTHVALERLKTSRRGLYCAPLRLLAMEIFDTLNRQGIYCDLLTGASVGRWDVTIRFWMAFDRTGEKKDTWRAHHLSND